MRTAPETQQRRALFSALQSFAGSPALLLDAEGRFEDGNQAARDFFECASESDLDLAWTAAFSSFDWPVAQAGAGEPQSRSASVSVNGHPRSVGLQLHALDREAGGGWFVLLKDCGVLNNLERELLLASECRGWVHRSALLVHDLRGIMNSMQISLELLSDPDAAAVPSPEESRRQRRIASLKEDLERMNAALRALPGSEREPEPATEQFDAHELVRDVLNTVRLLARRNSVQVRIELPGTPVLLSGRREWVRQGLLNIALHRLNAMRAGGQLRVAVTTAEGELKITLENNVPDLHGGATRGERVFNAGRGVSADADLLVARAICETAGGSLQIGAAASGGSIVEMTLPR